MTAFVGDILSATAAPVSAAPASSTTWSWLRNGATIPAATSTTYRVTVNDSGSSIQALQSETSFLGSASTASNALTISPWTPSALFTANEPGAWYDPSDLTTMFQDRAGTTPVTAPGQSVGLRLDKSRGLVLGPELVTNGTFDTDTSEWTPHLSAIVSWVSGQMSVESTTNDARNKAQQAISCVVGRAYQLRVTCTSGTPNIRVNDSASPTSTSALLVNTGSTLPIIFTATSTTHYVHVGPQGIGTAVFDNISVKEIPGNHAVAIADSSRGTYGIEPFGGRRNLEIRTQDFSNAYWTKSGGSITSSTEIAPDGTATACTLTGSGTGFVALMAQVVATGSATQSWHVKAVTETKCEIWNGGSVSLARFDLSAVTAVNTNGTGAFITSLGNGWFRIGVSSGSYAGQTRLILGHNAPTLSTSLQIWGVQVELGSTATNYQRVGSAFDVTEAGVPTVHYVQFDGADDGYVTSTITPGTDKVQVFAGVRKLSDAAGHIAGGNGNISGHWEILSSGWASPSSRYGAGFYTNVLAQIDSPPNFTPPRTDVLSWRFDTSGATGPDKAKLNVNGVAQTLTIVGLPTGANFAAFVHYIGRRGGTTLPFNGRDYGLVVRFGANLSTSEINRAEYYMAQRTGVTL